MRTIAQAGLYGASVLTDEETAQNLRDLTRTRKQLVREVAQHARRIQKVLEDANLKVASVLSNILGKSGRAMLAALIAGEADRSAWLPSRRAPPARSTPRWSRRCAAT
jgi:transposase